MTQLYVGQDKYGLPSAHTHSGMVERLNQSLEQVMSHYASRAPTGWDTLLPTSLFALRTATHTATQESPFFLNFLQDPRIPYQRALGLVPQRYNAGNDLYQRLEMEVPSIFNRVRSNLEHAALTRTRAQKGRVAPDSIPIGDVVFLKNNSSKGPIPSKLQALYSGPWRVTGRENSTYHIIPLGSPHLASKAVHFSKLRHGKRPVFPTPKEVISPPLPPEDKNGNEGGETGGDLLRYGNEPEEEEEEDPVLEGNTAATDKSALSPHQSQPNQSQFSPQPLPSPQQNLHQENQRPRPIGSSTPTTTSSDTSRRLRSHGPAPLLPFLPRQADDRTKRGRAPPKVDRTAEDEEPATGGGVEAEGQVKPDEGAEGAAPEGEETSHDEKTDPDQTETNSFYDSLDQFLR